MTRLYMIAAAALLTSACAATAPIQPANAQSTSGTYMPNSIQPETTLSVTGQGSADREPDMASVNIGVSVEENTAEKAMSVQAERMTAIFAAVKSAGIADRDMQTSNLSLNPVYDYNQKDDRPRLRGYNASNQITINVRDLDNLGSTLDAIVKAGSNQINSVSFGVEESVEAMDEARMAAVTDANRRAELYASAAGYRVKRIVMISEASYSSPPTPMMSRMVMAEAANTPIARGEVSLNASVNVTYELMK